MNLQTEFATLPRRQLIIWLSLIVVLTLLMVMVGGVTRLTDSGLSIVDWRPIMGAIPPLNEQQWVETFERYQKFPEYRLVNLGMTLEDFKSIFFWEYLHRLLGRLIGVVFFFPYAFFLLTRQLNFAWAFRLGFAFVLGGLQGLLGWYMVKSGLVNEPQVSHFRLAAHLLLAFVIIGYVTWNILDLKSKSYGHPVKDGVHQKGLRFFGDLFIFILLLQVAFGAFMAKLKGGLTYNTFPKMAGSWLPDEVFLFQPWIHNFKYNIATIQWTHRTLAWILVALGLSFVLVLPRYPLDRTQKKALWFLGGALGLQFLLGVLTLLYRVPFILGVFHQLWGCLLVLAGVFFFHSFWNGVKRSN